MTPATPLTDPASFFGGPGAHNTIDTDVQTAPDHIKAEYPAIVLEGGPSMVVVDMHFLLSNLRIFDHILKSGEWITVVPNPVASGYGSPVCDQR